MFVAMALAMFEEKKTKSSAVKLGPKHLVGALVLMVLGYLLGAAARSYIAQRTMQCVAVHTHLVGHHLGCQHVTGDEVVLDKRSQHVVDSVIGQSQESVDSRALPAPCEQKNNEDYSMAEAKFSFDHPTCEAPMRVCQGGLGFTATHVKWNTTSNCQLLLCSTDDCHKCVPVANTVANTVDSLYYQQGFQSALWVCS